jgi:hypothetical protein
MASGPDDDDKPLDPALLRVQARLRRLMLIAGLTLGLGIVAVLAAVLYRTFSAVPVLPVAPAVTAARLSLADLGLPADARLLASASDGTRLVLTYAHAGGNTLIFIDPRRLTVLGRLELPAGP